MNEWWLNIREGLGVIVWCVCEWWYKRKRNDDGSEEKQQSTLRSVGAGEDQDPTAGEGDLDPREDRNPQGPTRTRANKAPGDVR